MLRKPSVITAICLFFYLGAQILWGEKCFGYGGLGPDGYFFGTFAKTLDLNILRDANRGTRLFPALWIYYFCHFFSIELTNAVVIRAFELINLTLLVFSAVLWGRICKLVAFSRNAEWIGIALLFFNFGILKHAAYYPVMTDIPALFLSLAALNCYFREQRVLLALLTFIGAFTWPTAMVPGLILLVLPPSVFTLNVDGKKEHFLAALAAFFFLSVAVFGRYFHFSPVNKVPNDLFRSLMPVSILLMAAYLYFGLVPLLKIDLKQSFKFLNNRKILHNLILPVCIVLLFSWIGKSYQLFGKSNDHTVKILSYIPFGSFLPLLPMRATDRPLISILAHILYYGPGVVLLVFYWRNIPKHRDSIPLGIHLTVLAFFLYSLNSETRHLQFGMPFFAWILSRLISFEKVSNRFTLFFCLASLILSRFWIPFHKLLFNAPLHDPFMNIGPFMRDEHFSTALVIGLLTVSVVSLLTRRKHFVSQN